MEKYYAVKKGRQPGIYVTWAQTEKQVKGFKGAVFKKFDNLQQAQAFLKEKPVCHQHPDIWLYTDGGTRNTGTHAGGHVQADDKAAWAYLIKTAQRSYQASAGQYEATNNQMELTAVLRGLQKLTSLHYNSQKILLVADSQYVLNPLTQGWLTTWRQHGWKKADGRPVANRDLWQQLEQQLRLFSKLQFSWTKGHSNNKNNNFVDHLLNQTMDQM